MTTDLQKKPDVREDTLKAFLERSKGELEKALPKHLTPDRMLRIALTEARKNPALMECDRTSFLGAIVQASQLGLEPGAGLGHCWLVPFNNKKRGVKEVQFIIGYRGMISLADRSDRVSHTMARAVYAGDQFEYAFGINEKLVHVPAKVYNKEAKITHVYATVKLANGNYIFDVMPIEDVEGIRARSKSQDDGPWSTDYEAMAKKTVVRRLFKFTPVSVEIQRAVGLDELADAGESQGNGAVIETTGKPVTGKAQELAERLNPDPVQPEELKPPGSFNDFNS